MASKICWQPRRSVARELRTFVQPCGVRRDKAIEVKLCGCARRVSCSCAQSMESCMSRRFEAGDRASTALQRERPAEGFRLSFLLIAKSESGRVR
jgi:hypothetical protein